MILTHFLGLPRGLRSLGGSTCIQKQMKERESVMYLNKHHSAQVLCVKFSYFGCDPLAFIFTASWPSSRPPGSRSFNRLLRDSVHLVLLNLFHLSSIYLIAPPWPVVVCGVVLSRVWELVPRSPSDLLRSPPRPSWSQTFSSMHGHTQPDKYKCAKERALH